MVFAIRLFVLLLAAAHFSHELKAQRSCNVEAKLLLVLTQDSEDSKNGTLTTATALEQMNAVPAW